MMQLIETIDLLATRRLPDVIELEPHHHHHCELSQWFLYRNVKALSKDVRKELLAENLKSTTRRWLSAAGYQIAMVGQTLPSGYAIDGITKSPDGDMYLLNLNVCSSKTFKRLVKHGLDESERVVLSTMMLESGYLSKHGNTLNKTLTLLINRDNFEMFTIVTNVEPELCEIAEQQRHRVMESAIPPVANKSYRCNWCDYKDHCDKNQVSMVNCRTCANATIEGGEIVCEFGSKRCDKHLFHPALMKYAGYEFIGADRANMIIEYSDFANVTENGPRMDGKANMTSTEIHLAAGEPDFLSDDKFLELMAVFDGRIEKTEVK